MIKAIVSFLKRNSTLIKWLSTLLNIVSGAALILWLLNKEITLFNFTFDKEALFVILTSAAVSMNQFHKWLLKDAEYSPAYALALGYVNNFIEPTIVQLIENGIKNPVIYIFKPNSIEDLNKDSIDKVKARIKNMDFKLEEINLNLKHSRARDILTIQSSATNTVYFDFPNTLLSLSSYIDYKVNSTSNSSHDKEKIELTQVLFQKFYDKIDELAVSKQIDQHIKYCDSSLNFEV